MSHSFASRPTVIVRPSHATVQAMATACAMIACADGNVADKERRSFLRFLHHHGILERHGRARCLAAFNKALGEASLLDLDEICEAADQFSAVAGTHAAPLVAHAAAHVALADGITWPQEIALLEVIRNRIGLGYPPGWGSH
jgi:tellurite resistance protein